LSLLEGYREIAERQPEYRGSYLKVLAELEETEPENAAVQLALGRRDLESGSAEQAIEHLRHSIRLDPHPAAAYAYLSEALAQRGRLDEAVAASEKAVSIDPYNALYQKALIDRLIAAKQYDKALAAMEHYTETFPEDGEMRKMLDIAKK
jgi:tetratricopeptide (TPR) repeat protein